MKIALVNPYADSLSWFFYSQGMATPPYGLTSVATALRASGHDVRVFDGQATYEPQAQTRTRVLEWDPAVVGIGTTPMLHLYTFMSTTATPYWVRFADDLRGAGYAGTIVLGGTYATSRPAHILGRCPSIDAVAVGDGHTSMVDLCERLACGKPAEGNGIATRARPNAAPAQPTGAESLPDLTLLDGWPHQYGVDPSLFLDGRPERLLTTLPMLTAAGCPFHCTFCPTPTFFDSSYTKTPMDRVLAWIDASVKASGVRALSVWDDTFTVAPDDVRAFCRGLHERRLDVTWWCFGRTEWVCKHPHLIETMAEAGLRMMWLGVESPTPETLAEYNRKQTFQQAQRAVDILKANGVLATTSYIVGHPDSTHETLRRERDLSLELYERGSVNVYTMMIPLPGTRLHERFARSGQLRTTDLRLYSGTRAVLNYRNLAPEAVEDHFYEVYGNSILGERFLDHLGRVNLWSSDALPARAPRDLRGGFQREVARMRTLEADGPDRLAPWALETV